MKAYDLYKIDQPKVSPGNDFTPPHIPNGEIAMEPGNVNSDQNFIPNKPKNGTNAFPWEIIVLLGLGLIGTYIFLQIPPDENYRRRIR